MTKEELCKTVRQLCEEADQDFLFVLDGQSEWSVTSKSCDDLRRLVVMHKKNIYSE